MLTLTQMVNWICDKTGQNEPEEAAAAKRFLQHRLRMIWKVASWYDALAEATLPLDPTTDLLYARGLVPVPEVFERLLGVRTAERALVGEGLQLRYRLDVDTFEREGEAMINTELGGAVAVMPMPFYIRLFGNSSGTDAGQLVSVRYIDVMGARREESWLIQASQSWTSEFPATRIESVTKPATFDPVSVSVLVNPADRVGKSTYGGQPFPLVVGLDVNPLHVRVRDLAPTTTEAPKSLWLRLGERPQASLTLRMLGKVTCPLWGDNETSPLRGADDSLLAFALGDMEQRQRQFGRAREYFAEASTMLDLLKREESDETTQIQRITPTPDGGGNFNYW